VDIKTTPFLANIFRRLCDQPEAGRRADRWDGDGARIRPEVNRARRGHPRRQAVGAEQASFVLGRHIFHMKTAVTRSRP